MGRLALARGNLQRMLAAVPLTDDERAAAGDGQAALDKLLGQLAGTPTPAGPTPRQLGSHLAGLPVLQILPGPSGRPRPSETMPS